MERHVQDLRSIIREQMYRRMADEAKDDSEIADAIGTQELLREVSRKN